MGRDKREDLWFEKDQQGQKTKRKAGPKGQVGEMTPVIYPPLTKI